MQGLENFSMDMLSGLMAGGVVGAVIGAFAVLGYVIQIALYVVTIVGNWKIYNKFGEPGWKCLIPVYGTWVQYKYTWNPMMTIPVWVLGFGCGLLLQIISPESGLYGVFSILYLVGWIFNIVSYHKLSKAFGHGAGFTVGLVLVPSIFCAILGLGKSEYQGNTCSVVTDDQAE